MTYVASVIASNPDHYWRLNEGPGAVAALDYGNAPGMLWPQYRTVSGFAQFGMAGFGYGGITADGGSFECGANGLDNRVSSSVGAQNRYVPLTDPGTLEFWAFLEDSASAYNLGWFAPSGSVGAQNWSFSNTDNVAQFATLGSAIVTASIAPLGIWHHIAASWSNNSGFVYIDGTQVAPLSYVGPIGGGHVFFQIGGTGTANTGLNQHGLITEVATYRRALTVGDLDVHFNQAELKGQRPHWIGQRQTSSTAPVTLDWAYSLGVTHVARQGSASFSLPTGLRGLKIDLIPPFPPGRVSAGTPLYLWDVGWCAIANADGMLEEIRPNRDTRVWLPERMSIATLFTHDLNPGWTIDVTELDPS